VKGSWVIAEHVQRVFLLEVHVEQTVGEGVVQEEGEGVESKPVGELDVARRRRALGEVPAGTEEGGEVLTPAIAWSVQRSVSAKISFRATKHVHFCTWLGAHSYQ